MNVLPTHAPTQKRLALNALKLLGTTLKLMFIIHHPKDHPSDHPQFKGFVIIYRYPKSDPSASDHEDPPHPCADPQKMGPVANYVQQQNETVHWATPAEGANN